MGKKGTHSPPLGVPGTPFIFLFSSTSLLTTRTAYADNVSTLLETCPTQTMQSYSEEPGRAMGLVSAADSSWRNAEGPEGGVYGTTHGIRSAAGRTCDSRASSGRNC
jgi:hypothetical protein